ncbi:hypothetical protein AURDEDRAFT_129613 [Auricularia subglabra TFB-10046 SS5]|uniref:C2H2-type domain-containing protein n=1 Tax=Auricularia subglabra (strain TFB-10046 / SS5) TaxID=717982 RepID=J0CZQ5_AURST|nr:hypothetical protein AURDEDRAFT_129613 [Auricularia subglabra TFB-10046 SS5]
MPPISQSTQGGYIQTGHPPSDRLLWAQDPSSQTNTATTHAPLRARLPTAGNAQPGLVLPGGGPARPFAFGSDDHATFDVAVPPGPGILANLPSSGFEDTSPEGVPSQSDPGPGFDMDALYNDPHMQWLFVLDLYEIFSGRANSYEEIWDRYYGRQTNSSSTPELGPHAQEKQNIILRPIPTPDEVDMIANVMLIASLPPQTDVPVQPKTPRNQAVSRNNGQMNTKRSATHTKPCSVCAAAGRTTWHTPRGFTRHQKTHTTPPVACILCGVTIDGRGDMATRHRSTGRCAVFKQLKARGDHMVPIWADYWKMREHEQWGAGAHIKFAFQ